jgi:single-strand DNA-binding protein
MLIGNVGNEPEIRATSSGARVAKVSLATNRSWTDRNSGQKNEKTEWHRLTFFGRLVDVVEQWVKKGDRLYVEGRIEYSQTDGEGGPKYWTDIVINEMVMLGSSGAGGGGGQSGAYESESYGGRDSAGGGDRAVSVNDADDDLPF